jgi:hypothetical protein
MRKILSDYTLRIKECQLRVDKRNAMLTLVQCVLERIPLEACIHDGEYIANMAS